jgi:hypothetical protein
VLHSCLFLEKYELGVSNAWNATKLFINDDIPPINEFKKGNNQHSFILHILLVIINIRLLITNIHSCIELAS